MLGTETCSFGGIFKCLITFVQKKAKVLGQMLFYFDSQAFQYFCPNCDKSIGTNAFLVGYTNVSMFLSILGQKRKLMMQVCEKWGSNEANMAKLRLKQG